MAGQPDAGPAAEPSTAEVACLIPACGASLLLLTHGMGDKAPYRNHDEVRPNAGEEREPRHRHHGSRLQGREPEEEQRDRAGAQA